MPRLYRPSIPVEVRCRVVLRQLGELFIDDVIRANRFVPRVVPARSLERLLISLLTRLADLLGCKPKDLRLDHDPALENRMKRTVHEIHRGKLRQITIYSPDANSPDHLIYREHHAHHIKTNVRGEHGQFPDNTIAKRERRRLKKIAKKKKPREWSHRKSHAWVKARLADPPRGDKPKRKWPSRPFPKRRKKR